MSMDISEEISLLVDDVIDYAGEDYSENPNYSFVKTLVHNAIDEVCHEMHPYMYKSLEEKSKVEHMAVMYYRQKILSIAEYHFDKQGNEGVLARVENGVHDTYENSGTPKSYLRGINPIAKIV